jgi:hypothetical protein
VDAVTVLWIENAVILAIIAAWVGFDIRRRRNERLVDETDRRIPTSRDIDDQSEGP